MALKTNKNGSYTVTTKADAIKALKMMHERSDEAQALMTEHGITELMQEATELKKAATAYVVAQGIEKLDLGDSYATLRQDGYARQWIADKAQLVQFQLDGATDAVDLKTILQKKFKKDKDAFKEIWRRVTKRVVDANELQEVVDEGLLDEDEIAPAFVEKTKSPYLRVYPKET